MSKVKIFSRTIVLSLIVLIVAPFILPGFRIYGQEKKQKKEPEIHINVTTETDEYGNIIRYDSSYSWSYSNYDTIPHFSIFLDDSLSAIFPGEFFNRKFLMDSGFFPNDFFDIIPGFTDPFLFESSEIIPQFDLDSLFRRFDREHEYRMDPMFDLDDFFKQHQRIMEEFMYQFRLFNDSVLFYKQNHPVPRIKDPMVYRKKI